MIVAIALAYEFEQRLCEFAHPGIRERKWHHATLTAIASPIVAGKILGLSADQMVNATGISASHSCTPGAVTAGKLIQMKNTVDPMALASGVQAAQGYSLAAAIEDGMVTPAQFKPGKLKDPEIWNLPPKTEVVAEPEFEELFPRLKATEVLAAILQAMNTVAGWTFPTGTSVTP